MTGHRVRRLRRRNHRKVATERRAYLSLAAALDTPPRNIHITPRQARRLIRRELGAAA